MIYGYMRVSTAAQSKGNSLEEQERLYLVVQIVLLQPKTYLELANILQLGQQLCEQT